MIKIVDTEEEIKKLEELRLRCIRYVDDNYKMDDPRKTMMGQKMIDKEYIGIVLEENDKYVAGCIVSNRKPKLYLEWIFTERKKRKKGYATRLLNYLEDNIDIFSEYYNEDFDGILLEPYQCVEGFYLKNGYQLIENENMVKLLKRK